MLKIQDGCIYSAHIVALQTGRATILLNIKTKIVGSESHDVFPLVPYSKHMSHYKQHAPESTPFTMWQDLCVLLPVMPAGWPP